MSPFFVIFFLSYRSVQLSFAELYFLSLLGSQLSEGNVMGTIFRLEVYM